MRSAVASELLLKSGRVRSDSQNSSRRRAGGFELGAIAIEAAVTKLLPGPRDNSAVAAAFKPLDKSNVSICLFPWRFHYGSALIFLERAADISGLGLPIHLSDWSDGPMQRFKWMPRWSRKTLSASADSHSTGKPVAMWG
jgi:hypothetical protein